MSYFLTKQQIQIGVLDTLSGDEAAHILKSRRMNKGDVLEIQDTLGGRYKAEIKEIDRKSLKFIAVKELVVPLEPDVKVSLFISFINEKSLDFVLQKATELGAYEIVIFNSHNTAYKLSVDQFVSKSVRWQKILWEAAKQSGRSLVPKLSFLNDLDIAISELKKTEKIFLCDSEGVGLKNLGIYDQSFKSCAIVIGPEGGFTADEIKQMNSLANVEAIKLSNFTLRAETAALAALSAVLNSAR